MTRKQERKIEKAYNDRPAPTATLQHHPWMNELMNQDGTLSYAGRNYSWDYRLNLWVR